MADNRLSTSKPVLRWYECRLRILLLMGSLVAMVVGLLAVQRQQDWRTRHLEPPGLALRDERPSPTGEGRLNIEGEAIEGMVLEKRVSVLRVGQDNLVRLDRPRPSVLVPAGEYRIQEVRLRGSYRCSPPHRIGDPVTGQAREVGWFTISPDKPYTIRVGAPLKPTLRVVRCDRTLRMAYHLADVSGQEFWHYLPADFRGGKVADFAVYSGGKLVGSGSLGEYG